MSFICPLTRVLFTELRCSYSAVPHTVRHNHTKKSPKYNSEWFYMWKNHSECFVQHKSYIGGFYVFRNIFRAAKPPHTQTVEPISRHTVPVWKQYTKIAVGVCVSWTICCFNQPGSAVGLRSPQTPWIIGLYIYLSVERVHIDLMQS